MPVPDVISLLEDICDGLEVRRYIHKWKFLKENIPFLYDLFCELGSNTTSLPVEFRPIVKEMVRRAENPFITTPVHPSISATSTTSTDLHSYFPNLPVLWKRQVYKLKIKCALKYTVAILHFYLGYSLFFAVTVCYHQLVMFAFNVTTVF